MTAIGNDFIHEVLGERYKLEKVLGKKAGRRMVIAWDKLNNQLVAVKILLFGRDFSWEDLKLFEREAQILKSIHHPFIPEYLDFFDFDGGKGKGYVLVQSYVRGKSLEDYIQAGYKFSDAEIEEIASKLLSILEYLHQQKPPIIHRDIKPSNIIVQKKAATNYKKDQKEVFTVYLVDFGSVQTCASRAGNTMTVVGTYGYMPPEQFGGRAYPASDLYSLGTTLIACATGIHPADLPQQDMQIDFVRRTTLRENLTTWLSWLTHPNLEHRPQTVQDAIAVLRQSAFLSRSNQISVWQVMRQSIGRNLFVGGLIIPIAAGLYGTFLIPVYGTVFGAIFGFMTGFPISILNSFLVSLIMLDKHSDSDDSLEYKRTIQYLSAIIGTFGYLFGMTLFGFQDTSSMFALSLIPSIIVGLSFGVANRSFAYWYEEQKYK